MGNKLKKQQRMARIVQGSADAIVARPEMPFVLRNDQGLFINTAQLETPSQIYDADVAWVERKRSGVSLYFAKLSYPDSNPPIFLSRLEVRYSLEAFQAHFWKNSRDFHKKMKDGPVGKELADRGEPAFSPSTIKTEKAHSMWANFELMSHSGGEACVDLYHINPRTMALFQRDKDATKMDLMSVARVLLSSVELLALLDSCDPIIKSLPEKAGTP